MKILVNRIYNCPTYCISHVYVDGKYVCDAIEDTDRGITKDMPTAEIAKKKVYGKTAIPRGEYDVKLTFSPKFASRTWGKRYSGKVPQIMDVPCFSGVRLHPGNYASDVKGCLAVGYNKVAGQVVQSTQCFYDLMDNYIVPATKRGEKITISITKTYK